jgi:hypothetical protein
MRVRLTLLVLWTAGCDQSGIANPTGSCATADRGARAGYHDPGDSQWLRDCQNPRKRDYWRVFARSATSAYTIPRIDGDEGLQPICADPQHPLAPLTHKYPLCRQAENDAELALINGMLPADALALTHFLHVNLRFHPTPNGPAPYPVSPDFFDACNMPRASSADFQAVCAREEENVRSGFPIGLVYRGTAAAEMSERLNELYGVP